MQYIVGVLGLLGGLLYIIEVLRGKTKPNKATWIIWATIGFVFNLAYFFSGARLTLWGSIPGEINAIIISLLALKYGYSKLHKIDIACIVLAFIGLFAWIFTRNSDYAVYILLGCLFLGLLPTLVKVYYHPKSEALLPWVIGFIGVLLSNLFLLTNASFVVSVVPRYDITTKVILISLILRGYFIA